MAAGKRLTALSVKAITKPGRHSDGGGLYLTVKTSGAKSWVLLIQRDGRRREIGLGSLADVPLAAARAKAVEMRQAIARGEDPIGRRKSVHAMTFGMAAKALLADIEQGWRSEMHRGQWRAMATTYAASLRDKSVAEIGTDDVLAVLKPIWQRIPSTTSRTRGRIERVLDYAKARGWRSGENPARWRGHLSLMLSKPEKLRRGRHKALPFPDMPAFMGRLRDQAGLAARALEFLILTAARTSEVTGMRWEEIDLKAALWTVPAGRMKAGREHRVPLSPRAVAILKERRAEVTALELKSGFVFPGRKSGTPLSGGAMERVLDRMRVAVTVHGFRSSFRDWAGDHTAFPRELAEAALAHVVEDATERAYRRGDALEKRRTLMEQWSDFCWRVS